MSELLPGAVASPGWTILPAEVMTSAGSATLTRLPDGSILAGGPNPAVDTYTVEAVTTMSAITGLRLEALPDPSLPNYGPGRGPKNGNFQVHAICLSADLDPSTPTSCRVPLIRARADYEDLHEPGVRGVIGVLDEDPMTSWAIWPQAGRAHQAVFQSAEPFGTRARTRLRVELAFSSRWAHRARQVPPLGHGSAVPAFSAESLDDPRRCRPTVRTRLGAAYVLLGDWALAVTVLAQAAARPEASVLDDFLLALARHHLGRLDEAQSDSPERSSGSETVRPTRRPMMRRSKP